MANLTKQRHGWHLQIRNIREYYISAFCVNLAIILDNKAHLFVN